MRTLILWPAGQYLEFKLRKKILFPFDYIYATFIWTDVTLVGECNNPHLINITLLQTIKGCEEPLKTLKNEQILHHQVLAVKATVKKHIHVRSHSYPPTTKIRKIQK